VSETTEQLITQHLALESVHQALGANFVARAGWHLPASYGDERAEYAAVREDGAGLIDLSSRSRLQVSGSEAIQFLNGLITNDMKTLPENRWMPAAFPNVQGRLIASVRVLRTQDDLSGKSPSPTFLLDTESVTHERLLKTIERFTMAGDFRVSDITGKTALLSIQGKNAAEITGSVLGTPSIAIPRDGVVQIEWQQNEITVLRTTHTSEDGFDLIVSVAEAARLWDSLARAGARPVGHDALNTLRIEAGIPLYGKDMDETNVVTETNLDEAVSYTKGCYIGQEIIARIKYRGHVAKKLSGLVCAESAGIEMSATIKSDDNKEIGRVTSVTRSPLLGKSVALGYLKYDYLAVGTQVNIRSGERLSAATVTELPFVRGSWYEQTS
jgi:folate-binding protein YgfZ